MAHMPLTQLPHSQQQVLEQSQLQSSNANTEQFKIVYPNQQYVLPPVVTEHVATNSPQYQFYQPVNGQGQEGLDPSALVVQLGHNPSQHQSKRPWWIWAIAVADIVMAILLAVRVGHTIVTKDVFISDRDTLMWVFFLLFLSLAVQFMMGVGLILGLLSDEEATTVWYLQGWLCGAYFLICETSIVLLASVLKLKSGGEDVSFKLLLVILKTIFRVISFFLVRRYLADFRKRSMYRHAEADHQQHQMLMQHLQYQRQEREEHQRQLEQQQQLQQQEEILRLQQQLQLQQQQQLQQQHQPPQPPEHTPPPSSAPPSGGSGSNNHDYFCYAPQMSYMMTMMMDNSSTT